MSSCKGKFLEGNSKCNFCAHTNQESCFSYERSFSGPNVRSNQSQNTLKPEPKLEKGSNQLCEGREVKKLQEGSGVLREAGT